MEWLLDAERQYLEGIPNVQDENRRALMQVGLDAVQEEIRNRRAQKKGEQPSAPPSVPPKQVSRQEPPNMQRQPESDSQRQPIRLTEKIEPVLLESEVLTKVPPPTIPIRWANGEVKEMAEMELRRKAIDYFTDVVNSKRDPKDFYRSMQFNNCVIFLIGLYRFGNDLLSHLTLHSTFNQCGEAMQERSVELYRQVKESWEKYKDI